VPRQKGLAPCVSTPRQIFLARHRTVAGDKFSSWVQRVATKFDKNLMPASLHSICTVLSSVRFINIPIKALAKTGLIMYNDVPNHQTILNPLLVINLHSNLFCDWKRRELSLFMLWWDFTTKVDWKIFQDEKFFKESVRLPRELDKSSSALEKFRRLPVLKPRSILISFKFNGTGSDGSSGGALLG
jgi:hypothetical protein